MAPITASQVKDLRDATSVSMMECKRALQEADGNLEKATRLLRERGVAVAAKKASRAANDGLVASATTEDGKIVSLIEVNCETDFVARNADFVSFVQNLATRACDSDEGLADQVTAEVTEKVAEMGENIVVARNTRFVKQQPGTLESYVHLGGKVGVLVELGCEKEATAQETDFRALSRDLALHVAASNPTCLSPDELPKEDVTREREIYAKQVEDKPDQVIEKIVEGKMRKYYEQVCLLQQGFVKEPKQSIQNLLDEKGKALGDELTIRRFTQFQLGR
jgi:elongation factor Ts